MMMGRENPRPDAPLGWQDRGLCRTMDPDVFFPAGDAVGEIAYAKSFCKVCPVATECLDYATRNGIEHGIWGGLTEKERGPAPSPIGRPRKPLIHGTLAGYRAHYRYKIPICSECRAAKYDADDRRGRVGS